MTSCAILPAGGGVTKKQPKQKHEQMHFCVGTSTVDMLRSTVANKEPADPHGEYFFRHLYFWWRLRMTYRERKMHWKSEDLYEKIKSKTKYIINETLPGNQLG